MDVGYNAQVYLFLRFCLCLCWWLCSPKSECRLHINGNDFEWLYHIVFLETKRLICPRCNVLWLLVSSSLLLFLVGNHHPFWMLNTLLIVIKPHIYKACFHFFNAAGPLSLGVMLISLGNKNHYKRKQPIQSGKLISLACPIESPAIDS